MNKAKIKKVILVVLMISVFVIMLILNTLTPLIADDYAYSYQYNNREERITNIAEIIISQNCHYMTHGGRYLAHFFAQFFLMFDTKIIFNIFNAIMYVILTILIYLNCNYGKETNISLYILINALLFLFVPAWGQAFLWLTGSCNYLLTTDIILAFLLMFKMDTIKENGISESKKINILIFFFGFCAGMTNENSSIRFGYNIITYFINEKNKKRKNKKMAYNWFIRSYFRKYNINYSTREFCKIRWRCKWKYYAYIY